MTRHICADTQLSWYDPCPHLPKLTADDADLLITLLQAELGPKG